MITPDEIESLVEREMDYGMTHEQIKNFGINSHVTSARQLRQVLIEVERRHHDRKKYILDVERKKVKIEQLQAQIEITEDPYAIRLMELDLEEERLNMEKFQVTINQTDNELNAFMEWINKNYESFEKMKEASKYNEEEERKYWIARMGKQAAMDIYCTGKVGIGNIDSIAMMKEEDQIYALNIGMQYAGLLNTGIAKIQNELKPHLDKMLSDGSAARLPTFDNIEANLNLELFNQVSGHEQKSLQSTDQSETE